MKSDKILRGKGQITLVDITDNLQVEAYISTNLQRQVLYNPNNDVYLPNFGNTNMTLMPEIIVTGSKENQISNAKSVTWRVKENSKGEWKDITTDLNYTIREENLIITSNVLREFNTMLYSAEIEYELPNNEVITIYTDIELVKLSTGKDGVDGNDTIAGVLTNDSMIFSSNTEGKVDSVSQIGYFNIYTGTIKLTNNIHYSFQENPYLNLYIDSSGEYAVSWKDDTKSRAVVNTKATFKALVIKDNDKIEIEKSVSVSKASLGSSGITYYLEPNSDIITIDKAGNLVPSSLKIDLKKRDGLKPVEPYFADVVALYSEDNVNFTEITSVKIANSISIKVPKSATSIKVNMYHTETNTLLDSETIPVIAYSYPKVDFFITTPMGELILNHEGILQAEAHLFENSKKIDIKPKWYKRDSGKKTGWDYLTETKLLIANAENINGSSVYKAEITYKGITYYDFVTFSDITDNYQLRILGATTFTQNRGVLDLIAKVYFEGEEIDKEGSKFLYFWTLYDSAGKKVSLGRELNTKEIVLHKDEVKNIMELECKIQSTNESVLFEVGRSISVGNIEVNYPIERYLGIKDKEKGYTAIRDLSTFETAPLNTFVRDIATIETSDKITNRNISIADYEYYNTLREINLLDKSEYYSAIRDLSSFETSLKSITRDISTIDMFKSIVNRDISIKDIGSLYQTNRLLGYSDIVSVDTMREVILEDILGTSTKRIIEVDNLTWADIGTHKWIDAMTSTWEELNKEK